MYGGYSKSTTPKRQRMTAECITDAKAGCLVLASKGQKEISGDHRLAGTCNLRPDCISQQT